MKKLLAFLVVASLLATAALCAFSVSAEEPTNIALGKSYTGGVPSTHDHVKVYNANLTDGKAADAISYDGEWFAFYFNADATGEGNINAPDRIGTVVIDLEKVYNVNTVKVNAFLGNASGIVAPSSVKAEVSVDGSTYTQLGSTMTYEKPAENDVTVDWVVISGDAVEGQYIRVTVAMDPYAPYAFINEIKAYGDEKTDDVPSEDETTPDEGDETTPAEGDETTPAEGDETTPAEGDETTPAEGDETTPAESTPVESTPAESTPAESTPAESTPAESTPAESIPATSSTPETSAPTTGDEGMIIFAVLAVVALAGAFVAIRVRH